MSLTVVCVLWPGGDFGARDVTALRVGLEDHLSIPHRFVCITNEDVDCDSVPPLHDWWTRRGWWGKLEVFRPDLPGDHRLYLDLDSLPVGDLTRLAQWRGDFAGMRDVYQPKRLQASILSFDPEGVARELYEEFRANPDAIASRWHGDQWWFTDRVRDAVRLQDEVPGVYSLKVHARTGPPDDASVIVAHGKPRLSDPAAGWAHDVWRQRVAS